MNRRKILTIMLLVIFIVSAIFPITGVKAATDETITFNSALYQALKSNLQSQGIKATYNDAQNTLTISDDEIAKVTSLNLSNKSISDLTGLDVFSNVTFIDLSANELTADSNLDVLNNFTLSTLDLSSNQISNLSAITNIDDIATLNLHNQIVSDVIVVDNSIVKGGNVKYIAELPEIIKDFAKPIKSEWLTESYINNETETGYDSDIRFDWSTFNSYSDSVKIIIGTQAGEKYNGLASLKIKITDMSNKLYNSEIDLYYVIINEGQKAVAFKDNNLYKATKAQLTQGQTINLDLDTTTENLYDYAYDDQQILVISENTLVNKIPSLLLSNSQIEDLEGIEMFIGLEDSLDLSSNYIEKIERIVDLQTNKELEELHLQKSFKEKTSILQEKLNKLSILKSEAFSVIEAYNEAVGRYNSYVDSEDQNKVQNELEQLGIIKPQAKRYIQLTGNSLTIFGVTYTTAESIDYALNEAIDTRIAEIPVTTVSGKKVITVSGGEITAASNQVEAKLQDLYEMYNNLFEISSIITPELKNLTDKEFNNLTLENAKTLLQNQITKLKTIESSLTTYERNYLTTYYGIDFSTDEETPVAKYFDALTEALEENNDIAQYKAELYKLRVFDSFVISTNHCLINRYITGSTDCVGEQDKVINLKLQDGESVNYINTGYNRHTALGTVNCNFVDVIALAERVGLSTESDINAYIVLPKLYQLDITENLVENINNISKLSDLRELYAGENEIVSIKDVNWSAISKLNVLDLSFNEISEIKDLECLQNLKVLDLSKNLISGELDFTISNLEKIESLDLSSNQIDNIEYLKEQYEYIARAHGMSITDYLVSAYAPDINLKNQTVVINVEIDKNSTSTEIELPLIFRQLEELQWNKTSFGIESVYGNVTSDGKYVRLNTNALGIKTAEVTVYGTGIGAGSTCIIKYELVEKEDDDNGNTNTSVQMTITTGDIVKSVKKVNNKNYVLVYEDTTVEELLDKVSLNSDDHFAIVMESNNTLDLNDVLKTGYQLVVEGLTSGPKCTVVVLGDVTGDGQVTMGDLIKLNKFRLNKTELTEAQKLAGNVVDIDDEITMSDIIKLNRYRLDNSVKL